jgi:AcrR family transcriptional regulator
MSQSSPGTDPDVLDDADTATTDWQRRVVGRSLKTAKKRSIDRGAGLIRAAAVLLERSNGDNFGVQEVADEAGQSLRTLYQYFESKDDLLLALFEEAMRTYATMIRGAIAPFDDPLERLAAAIVAAVRIPEQNRTGIDRGLARLRLKLGESAPDLVARSQAPVTSILSELVAAAAEAGQVHAPDPEAAAYMIAALNSSFVTSHVLGNDVGLRVPDVVELTTFHLQALGARVEPAWLDDLMERIELPERAPTA